MLKCYDLQPSFPVLLNQNLQAEVSNNELTEEFEVERHLSNES